VRERVLAIEHVRARLLEQRARLTAELDRDHRIEGAVSDRDGRQRRVEVELEAFDGRHEAVEGDDPRGPRAAASESERVAHHGTLREAAEDRPLVGQVEPVEPRRDALVRRQEGIRVRKPNLADRVPVCAARRKNERPARRDPEQAPLGIERVEQWDEVVLVRAAAMEEDERALGFAR